MTPQSVVVEAATSDEAVRVDFYEDGFCHGSEDTSPFAYTYPHSRQRHAHLDGEGPRRDGERRNLGRGFDRRGDRRRRWSGRWRHGAHGSRGDRSRQIRATAPRNRVDGIVDAGGHLTNDIEGLTLYDGDAGGGYLIASSQGSDEYAVYERSGPNAYVSRFSIAAGTADGVSNTDGIDVTNAPLGSPSRRGCPSPRTTAT